MKMGLFDKLFHKEPTARRPAPNLGGWLPMYPQFGTDIYASDAVQQALKCIADEIKKLNPQHIRMNGNDPVPVKGNVQDVLNEPNALMTTSEFLEKITYLLLMNYNVFIIPVYHTWTDEATGQTRRYYEALFPINPSQVDFIQDSTDRIFVKFWFRNGYETTIPYDDVIHIKYNYSVSDYMGGNEMGQPDRAALLETLKLNDTLLKGVAKAMQASYTVNGIIRYNTILSDDTMTRNLEEFNNKLMTNTSGIIPLDLKADYTPLEKKSQFVDPATLKFVDEKILRTWGIPVEVLNGSESQDIYNAFYQRCLEPLIISISQAFTKKLFTKGEKARGNRIELYPKDLIFMTVQQTLEMIDILAPTGALFENEKRAALGLRPLPELEGKRYMSLNWIDADKADQYQIGNVNVDVVDENKTEMEEEI